MPKISDIHKNGPTSTSTNCAQCHSSANALNFNKISTMSPPIVSEKSVTSHVAMGALQDCVSCHVGASTNMVSVSSLLATDTPAFSGSAFDHGTTMTTGCASCHGANMTITNVPGLKTFTNLGTANALHVPNPSALACETCHVGSVPSGQVPAAGASGSMKTFAGGQFSHSGIKNSCDSCHGANQGSLFLNTQIVEIPATHVPSSSTVNMAKCETCHMGSLTSLVLAGAKASPLTGPGTKFQNPIPLGTVIHTGVTSGCDSCHEQGANWMGMGLYARTSTISSATGASYVGFQARPYPNGTGYSLSATHPDRATSADCANCHFSTASFIAEAKPINHIPTANVSCTACHTGSDYSLMPASKITAIHANGPVPTASNCEQCHSVANAAYYALPVAAFTIKAPSATHVPLNGTTKCEVCHVGTGTSIPNGTVVNGSNFSTALYSHSGITSGCAACHGSAGAQGFNGIPAANLVFVNPVSTTQGPNSHIPANATATCESCHSSASLIPGGLLSVATAKAGLGATSFRLPAPTGVSIHANSGMPLCATCHEKAYQWLGVSATFYTRTSSIAAGPNFVGFQTRPTASTTTYGLIDSGHDSGSLASGECSQCHSSTTVFTAIAKPTGHVPTTLTTCSTCHLISGDYSSAVGKLATSATMHTGFSTTSGCISCHTKGAGTTVAPFAGCLTQAICTSPPSMIYQPTVMPLLSGAAATTPSTSTHIPVAGVACEGCHVANNFTTFLLATPKSAMNHTVVTKQTCMSCHEWAYTWYGVTIKVRDSKTHHAGQDCNASGCHSTTTFKKMALGRPVMREALLNTELGRLLPNLQITQPTRGTLGTTYDHQGVESGKCKTCHDGQRATGMRARHLMVTNSCDACHRTTSWLPAQFSHNGISPNTCQVCHNGMGASPKPAGHFITPRSCDSCHKTNNWLLANYSHMSPSYRPLPDKLSCVSCHISNSEIIPKQMRALNRIKPNLVGP